MNWALRARRYDHYLTAESPVCFWVHVHETTTPLGVDYHDGIEVGVVLSGREELHWGGFMYQANPGDVWLVPMWEPHGYRTTLPNTQYAIMVFLPEFLGETTFDDMSWLSLFAVPPPHRPRITTDQQRGWILQVTQRMRIEMEQPRPRALVATRLCLTELLFELSRSWTPPRPTGAQTATPTSSLGRIMPALDLLRKRGPAVVGVTEAAHACGMSRSLLNRLFHRTVGVSFVQLRTRAHLTHAAHLLLTTDLKVEQVAAEAGFSDGSHLHRVFLKQYGCTPGQYRARGRRAVA
jgi:AraC-like DNA-binding protein